MGELPLYKINPPFWQINGFIQTVAPTLTQRKPQITYIRERISTPDDDFLDLDWLLQTDKEKLVILSHGLEGNSNKVYITNAAKYFQDHQYNVLAWNNRGCSGEENKTLKLNHHGETDDIHLIVNHAIRKYGFRKVYLMGYSLGGSITLNYVARKADILPKEILGAVAISTPCDLRSASQSLDERKNWFFKDLFFKKISKRVIGKELQFPNTFDVDKLKKVKSWKDFDNEFSAKLCGFKHADDFYDNVSSLPHLPKIKMNTLILNAINDPILTEKCHPKEMVKSNKNLKLILTDHGGHVGFLERNHQHSFMERAALQFFEGNYDSHI